MENLKNIAPIEDFNWDAYENGDAGDLVGVEGDAPHRQRRVSNALKQLCAFVDDGTAQIGRGIKPHRAVGCLGDDPAVTVGLGQTTVAALIHVLPVVAHFQSDGFRHQLLFREPEHQNLRHLSDNEFCFIIRVWKRHSYWA